MRAGKIGAALGLRGHTLRPDRRDITRVLACCVNRSARMTFRFFNKRGELR